MQEKKAFSITDLIILVATICILALILMPVMIRAKSSVDERCQSNMNRIGIALLMYQSDWDDRYPTNRLAPPWNAFIARTVPLSHPSLITSTGDPVKFQYGVNWIEALYPYLGDEKAVATADPCVWRCPAADKRRVGGDYAAATYAFNWNLVETRNSSVRYPGKLMMVRELAGQYDAVLRPTNLSMDSTRLPIDPFLDSSEVSITNPKYKPHDEGSHILFADGSVKYFSVAYFPDSACVWDGVENKWYNNPTGAQPGDVRIKAIAINP